VSKLIDALTLAVVAEEAEKALQNYLDYHYQQNFLYV